MITKKDSLCTGVLDYFRNALAAIGRHSRFGNEKYPPAGGTRELRWSFDVSTDHADAIASHLSQRGQIDPETGYSHTVALAWRALALLETELIAAGASPGRAVVRSAPPPSVLAEATLALAEKPENPPTQPKPQRAWQVWFKESCIEDHRSMYFPWSHYRSKVAAQDAIDTHAATLPFPKDHYYPKLVTL